MLIVQLTAHQPKHISVEVQLGRKIRAIREDRRMTQKELGKAVGITQWQIGRIENAKWSPGLQAISWIAQAFGMTLSQLFEGITLG
jgi:putative transcriptional regulator